MLMVTTPTAVELLTGTLEVRLVDGAAVALAGGLWGAGHGGRSGALEERVRRAVVQVGRALGCRLCVGRRVMVVQVVTRHTGRYCRRRATTGGTRVTVVVHGCHLGTCG